jgi:hypothetical protein
LPLFIIDRNNSPKTGKYPGVILLFIRGVPPVKIQNQNPEWDGNDTPRQRNSCRITKEETVLWNAELPVNPEYLVNIFDSGYETK